MAPHFLCKYLYGSKELKVRISAMGSNYNTEYESPWLRVITIEFEGVLCESNEPVDKNDGLW